MWCNLNKTQSVTRDRKSLDDLPVRGQCTERKTRWSTEVAGRRQASDTPPAQEAQEQTACRLNNVRRMPSSRRNSGMEDCSFYSSAYREFWLGGEQPRQMRSQDVLAEHEQVLRADWYSWAAAAWPRVLACGIAFELERKRRRAKHVSQHARLPCPKAMSAHSGNRACCPSVVIDDGSTGLQPPPLPLRF